MERGRVAMQGSARELLQSEHLKSVYLGSHAAPRNAAAAASH
jgi:ABC-type lipopolysaccharide export system ATPase subunit